MSYLNEFFTGCFARFNEKCPKGLRRRNVKGFLKIRSTFFLVSHKVTAMELRKDLPIWITYFAPKDADRADLEMFRATLDEVLADYDKK